MRHLDLFSGLGSWALAARHVWGDEYECAGFCEIDHFCRMVLTKNFPGVPIYGDIRTLADSLSTGLARRGQETEGQSGQPDREWGDQTPFGDVQLITASPPCQAASSAGKRRGKADNRWLWPQTLDVIRAVRPTYAILENVLGLLSLEHGLVFEELCLELEAIGYSLQTFIIPAAAVGAPHRRDRIWLVANTTNPGARDTPRTSRGQGRPAVPLRTRSLQQPDRTPGARWPNPSAWDRDWREIAASTCVLDVAHGPAGELVQLPDGSTITRNRWRKEALKAIGNAIVPAVAIEIMKAIKSASLGASDMAQVANVHAITINCDLTG